MSGLDDVVWPPAPIRTERLVLRESEAGDRATFLELFSAPDVFAYLGGPRARDELERDAPEVPGHRPGSFVVEHGGAMIGMVTLDRRAADRPGRVRPDGGDAELGYLFLPGSWGHGYAGEACVAALGWFAGAVPGEPVVLCTQTANDRAMRLATRLGFTEVARFEEFGAEQWFGVWTRPRFPHGESRRKRRGILWRSPQKEQDDMYQGPPQSWQQERQAGPFAEPPRSTAMLTATWVVTSIVGFAYIGLFVLMGLGASDEISTIEEMKELKAGGAQVTNTVADLDASIAENELAIVVFLTGAALTLPLVIVSFLGRTGRAWVRGLATAFLLPPVVVIVFGVIHDINDGHPENAFAFVFTIPAIVLAIMWWLPPTTRAMLARRMRRAPATPPMHAPYPSHR